MQGNKTFGDVQSAITQLDQLSQAIIDTSSLIYLQELALLAETSQWIRLFTVPGVIREFGGITPPCRIRIIEDPGNSNAPDKTDDELCRAAEKWQLPIISEDRQILMRARAFHLPVFNTLMVLNGLFSKDLIGPAEYHAALRQLRGIARYSEEIYEFAQMVFVSIEKRLSL